MRFGLLGGIFSLYLNENDDVPTEALNGSVSGVV